MVERDYDFHWQESPVRIAVVGGGPTGVELAGAIAEVANKTLKGQFKKFDPSNLEVVLFEGSSRVLPHYDQKISRMAHETLVSYGVRIITNAKVRDIGAYQVSYETNGQARQLTVVETIWAAGVRASGLGKILVQHGSATLDMQGRVIVDKNLTLADYKDVYIIGDLAHVLQDDGLILPGIAPVAMQQGRYVGQQLKAIVAGTSPAKAMGPFKYIHRGNMAVIGRRDAVVDFGRLKFKGTVGWLVWLFVHIMYLVGFSNRILVLLQWAWNFFTHGRSSRLIAYYGELHKSKQSLHVTSGRGENLLASSPKTV